MASVFDRYGKFRDMGTNYIVPFCSIKESETDKYVTYRKGKTRLDNISYEIYGSPDYDWLIMQANPECGSMEYEIKDGTILRVPFPLIDTLAQYNNDIENQKKGIN
jgi:hypothetical protein